MTDIIVGSRGSGKSTELLKKSADENVYILTGNRSQAQDLVNKARELGLTIPFPVTWEDYVKGRLQGTYIQKDGVLIDEASHILSRALQGIPVKAVTWTKSGFRDLDEENPERCLDNLWKRYQVTGFEGDYKLWLDTREKFKTEHALRKRLEETEGLLEKAYAVIGQLVEKPNCFGED